MPYKDPEVARARAKEYKRKQRELRGALPKGKHIRPERTEEQLKASYENKKEYQRAWHAKYSDWKPAKRLLWAAKRRAKIGNFEFSIEESDIIIPTHCPYLGIPLVNTRPRGDARRDIASLDRIDPTKGYTKDNIEVISWLANTMKNNATPDLLINFAEEILRRYKN